MLNLANKQVLVVGLGLRGRAACDLLVGAGARVVGIDSADTADLRVEQKRLQSLGVDVRLGTYSAPEMDFVAAVVSPAVPMIAPVVQLLLKRNIPVIGELELCFRQSRCLSIAIGGTNGKSTTAELVEQMLIHNHRKTFATGPGAWPLASIAEQTKDLDFVLFQANSFQLERTQFFRPAVSVLLNLSTEHPERYSGKESYARANARLFANQQAFDWAIIQTEALAQLKELGLEPPSKTITFSAHDQQSDLYLDRGLIISRLENWPGPLLDMDQCLLRGPHNAENMMAALAVGHALRLPLETMVETLKTQAHRAHRFELVTEIGGIQFINDAKAANVGALQNALLGARPGVEGKPNVWLIAGGNDEGLDFHAVSPLISKRVKGAFLIGRAGEKIRSAWSLFTPCTLTDSLLEAVTEATKVAVSGDVVLLSPASSSFEEFQNYQKCGEKFYILAKSISRGGSSDHPNITGKTATT